MKKSFKKQKWVWIRQNIKKTFDLKPIFCYLILRLTAMRKRSKAYQKAAKNFRNKIYALEEAVEILLKNKTAKFDETLELHLNLNLKKGKDKVPFRLLITPPYPVGRPPKIAALVDKLKIKDKNIISDHTEIIKQIKNQKINFDVLIANKDYIAKITPYAKFLGPKGLMPTAKNQTLTENPDKVIENLLKGQREIRADEYALVHIPCGRLSLGKEKLLKNIRFFIDQVKQNRPEGIKGEFVLKVYLTTTMSPSLKVKID